MGSSLGIKHSAKLLGIFIDSDHLNPLKESPTTLTYIQTFSYPIKENVLYIFQKFQLRNFIVHVILTENICII